MKMTHLIKNNPKDKTKPPQINKKTRSPIYTKRIKIFIKHCKLHSIAFKHNAPQSTDFQSKPTVVHSCTVHELGQNSFQLTLKIPTQLLRARNGGVTPHFWSLMSDEEHQENYENEEKEMILDFFFKKYI